MKVIVDGRVVYGIRVERDYPRCSGCELTDATEAFPSGACLERRRILSTPDVMHICEGQGLNPSGDLVFKYADKNPGIEVEWTAQRLEGKV